MEFSFLHNTPTSKVIIKFKTNWVYANNLFKYEDKIFFNNLCKTGCVNYEAKWSCPPFSPSYSVYSKDYNYCFLILMICDLSQFDYVKTEYMKVKTSNSILKSQSDKLSRFLEKEYNGKMLSNGSCRLCKPCTKKVSAGGCRNPLMLRYSLESLGLNVDRISKEIFTHELLWYKNKTAPSYSSVMSGILTKELTVEEKTIQLIKEYSYIYDIKLFES